MAVSRITIPKNVWSKVVNKASRKGNEDLKKAVSQFRSTDSPQGKVLWAPDKEVIQKLAVILEEEAGFVRRGREDGTNHQNLLRTIRQMKSYLNE